MVLGWFKSDFFNLIKKESSLELRRLFFISCYVGLLGAALIAVINQAASKVEKNESTTLLFLVFLVFLLLNLFLTRISNRENIKATQDLVHKFRMRVVYQVLKSDILSVNKIGRTEILTAISRDAQMISGAIIVLVNTLQGAALLFFSILYLAVISLPAALISILFGGFIFVIFSQRVHAAHGGLHAAWGEESNVYNSFTDFLYGYKEVVMNSDRALAMTDDLIYTSRRARDLKSSSLINLSNNYSYIQIMFYLLVGVMIFVVPVFSSHFSENVVKVATTAVFMIGSLTGIIQSLPVLSQANTSAAELNNLSNQLEQIITTDDAQISQEFASVIESIQLQDICYEYLDDTKEVKFAIGPISYEFKKGNVYFVRGNNGSGKTSLINVIVGLYRASSGFIFVNGERVINPASPSYRNLYSAVFSDFYLFKKLYGIKNFDVKIFDELLTTLSIKDKVNLYNSTFGDLNLSTGQRKRLALIISMMESRDVIILDEWAADQDPEFRKFFYEVIIPRLKAQGKIVIAITHDDNYFHLADHLLLIEHGTMSEIG
jgi:putative ATP-binding cassette transporter